MASSARYGGPSIVNKEQQKVRVLAIDPAPRRKSTVFDGTDFLKKSGDALRAYLNEPGSPMHETLVCWDAPLTGPSQSCIRRNQPF